MNRKGDCVRRGFVVCALLVASVGAAVSAESDPAAGQSALKDARTAIQKWVETSQLASRERQDWELGRQMLEDRAALVEREIKDLAERTAEARRQADEAVKGKAELVTERDSLEAAAAYLAERAPAIERRLRDEVLPLLPEVLARQIAPMVRRLPENPAGAKIPLPERFQNIVGILNAIDKFNRDVTVARELQAAGDGRTAEMRTMYLGLGQGFYADPNKGIAGRGAPGASGWKWEALPGAAAEIAEAIGGTENKKAAEFVPLPVKIR